ncbi:EVE domain-containing protein [Gellertiella hungarica]|uniref:UPF0310 protein GGR23_000167 n=1 Tax=Gellertiella hungarica TaxID=1572859 RepID=A0A7W6J2X5_9HYPH|nr:EVE domain-containing protein [Gellertiella hungarica]MBB4063006.1 hypothetical protein [Gellertiella hungarica]
MDWLAVASADHVEIGKRGGFMQVCHGKGGPLRRIGPGDRVVYYSPSQRFGVRDGLMQLTAFGTAIGLAPYRHDMGGGFVPFRLDVRWTEARAVPIRLLLDRLSLTRGRSNWAYPFRFGLVPLCQEDMDTIAEAMGAGHSPADMPAPPRRPESPQFQLF